MFFNSKFYDYLNKSFKQAIKQKSKLYCVEKNYTLSQYILLQYFITIIDNGIQIEAWYEDPNDNRLNELIPFLEEMR